MRHALQAHGTRQPGRWWRLGTSTAQEHSFVNQPHNSQLFEAPASKQYKQVLSLTSTTTSSSRCACSSLTSACMLCTCQTGGQRFRHEVQLRHASSCVEARCSPHQLSRRRNAAGQQGQHHGLRHESQAGYLNHCAAAESLAVDRSPRPCWAAWALATRASCL